MKPSLQSFRTVFAKNRTEELGADVYRHFVVPHFYDQLDLRIARKPRLLIGGRGCGKTMLLRYLSHQSAFSQDRTTIPDDAIEHIGLYWRVDTQFAAIMNERGLAGDVWHSAFNHLLALLLALELVSSVSNIAASSCTLFNETDLKKVSFDRLSIFDPTFIGDSSQFKRSLQDKLWEFELWVANVRKAKEPIFLPGVQFLAAIIGHLKSALPTLAPANFYVYVDEFENLLPYQQRILNTCLKHSEIPLIFNIAMKRHAFETKDTVGTEAIQNIADYREHDLEKYLLDSNFPVFAAEVLFLNLALAGLKNLPIDPAELQNPDAISKRKTKSYIEPLLRKVGALFPGLTHEELAKAVFMNESLTRTLQDRIRLALQSRGSSKSVESFFFPELPQATITVPALLHRKRLAVEDVELELLQLRENQKGKFAGTNGWIHNNFIGCLLWLYDSHSSPCPLYSGFDTFCLLSRGNLRHLLELCHISLNQLSEADLTELKPVPPAAQAKGARQASAAFLNEIPTFGRLGDRLHTFVFRLGSLFALAHRRPSQSEPEQCHFAITSGEEPISRENIEFLNEAEKWSVIFQEEETKLKQEVRIVSFQYVLNPVYSPFFNITYRKIRKLELSQQDVDILIRGSFDQAKELLGRFSKNWRTEAPRSSTLFFHFGEEAST